MAHTNSKHTEKLWNSNYVKVWLANFMIFFSFMLLTPLLPTYLSESFHADKDTIGMVLSGYTITTLIVRALSGYMVDSFPRRMVLVISYTIFCLFFLGYIAAGSLLLFAIVRTLHGAPFGATTVSNSTVAIDVLPSSRRAEGIGYYGLSNNIATAISPTVAILVYGACNDFKVLFWLAFATSAIGLALTASVKNPHRPTVKRKAPLSLDRFILLKGLSQGFSIICFAFSYGVLATYVAIYGKDELGITRGTGLFFALLAFGLICARLLGNRSLREGKASQNAVIGTTIAAIGYLLFAMLHNKVGYYSAAFIIGLGNGYMFPAFQTMFINLAPNEQRGTANSTMLVSWDIGIGLGILVGGVTAEHFGYHTTFWSAWVVNVVGLAIFFFYGRQKYLKGRLR